MPFLSSCRKLLFGTIVHSFWVTFVTSFGHTSVCSSLITSVTKSSLATIDAPEHIGKGSQVFAKDDLEEVTKSFAVILRSLLNNQNLLSPFGL